MGNKKPTNGFNKDPKRASLAGKKSSRALPPELKSARTQNALEFEALIYKYMNAPLSELKKIMLQPATPAKDLIVIKILALAIEKGDHARLGFLLERTIGKVPQEHVISTKSVHEQVMDELEADKNEHKK
jgi:hypothetical protein